MDIKKYIYGHCVHPRKIRMWDAYSQSYVVRFVPCGKCLHCNNTHINEWVTRLVAQKLYSKYCYYVSLDYAPFTLTDPMSYQLAKETAACYHCINKNHTYGMHPLVLCKNHLQDFYKRLRKNTGIKLQYFACGEYGMHAEGKGFGRPHFHNIIFSDTPLTVADFSDAWTINGYKIGRVDFTDMSSVTAGDTNQINIFKYVCKYLQKSDFNFEELATIDFHRAFFMSIHSTIKAATDLFSSDTTVIPEDGELSEYDWKQYIKQYSPFIVCSRRPSIGSAYLAEHLERFKEQDFRLFGLPDVCSTFPRYYLRRTKESLIDFRCIGEVSKMPSSPARLGILSSVLTQLYNDRLDLSSWTESVETPWCVRSFKNLGTCIKYNDKYVPVSWFNFYDDKNKFLYQFNGYHYNVWAKIKGIYSLLDTMDIIDVLHELSPSWDRFHKTFVTPMYDQRVRLEKELDDYITHMYKPFGNKSSYDLFFEEVYSRYNAELQAQYKTKLLMQNSKQTL